MADISKQKSTVESKKSKTRKGSQAVACLSRIKNKNVFFKLCDSYPTTLGRHSSRQHKDKIPLAELKKYIYPLDHEKIKAALEEFMPNYQSQISVTDAAKRSSSESDNIQSSTPAKRLVTESHFPSLDANVENDSSFDVDDPVIVEAENEETPSLSVLSRSSSIMSYLDKSQPSEELKLLRENNNILKGIEKKIESLSSQSAQSTTSMNVSSGQSHSNDLQLLKELSSISELESISTPSINLIITESPGNGAGYMVKCCHCEAYLNDDSKIDQKVQRSIGSTFAGGHHLPLSTYEIYNEGSNLSNPESKRKWINFKSTLVQHHLLLTHKKAVEYHEKRKKLPLKGMIGSQGI